ncbi:MAG: carbohydrate ABC transporter permease [Thermomicrobiales bacterium]
MINVGSRPGRLARSTSATAGETEAASQRTHGKGEWASNRCLALVSVIFLFPFFWMVASGLKTKEQLFRVPIEWIPNPAQWSNFLIALDYPGFPYFRLLWNSVFYAGLVAVGTVLSCAAVGYGFARLKFPGRDILFAITLATLMVPPIVTYIPQYILFAKLHVTGTYIPLIFPKFLGDAFFIFMIRQFYLSIPWDLSDAARIDGANEFRIFWEIMLPLVRPALVVVAVFSLLYTWHDFFGPLIYLQDREMYPLTLGLFAFQGQRTIEWPLIMAGATLTTLPMIIVFLFTQRYFIRGIATTGLKG